jgi:hypothetical protein
MPQNYFRNRSDRSDPFCLPAPPGPPRACSWVKEIRKLEDGAHNLVSFLAAWPPLRGGQAGGNGLWRAPRGLAG